MILLCDLRGLCDLFREPLLCQGSRQGLKERGLGKGHFPLFPFPLSITHPFSLSHSLFPLKVRNWTDPGLVHHLFALSKTCPPDPGLVHHLIALSRTCPPFIGLGIKGRES